MNSTKCDILARVLCPWVLMVNQATVHENQFVTHCTGFNVQFYPKNKNVTNTNGPAVWTKVNVAKKLTLTEISSYRVL